MKYCLIVLGSQTYSKRHGEYHIQVNGGLPLPLRLTLGVVIPLMSISVKMEITDVNQQLSLV